MRYVALDLYCIYLCTMCTLGCRRGIPQGTLASQSHLHVYFSLVLWCDFCKKDHNIHDSKCHVGVQYKLYVHIMLVVYMSHYFCYRAIKNGKGVHSKKEPVPHRVAELSTVRKNLVLKTDLVLLLLFDFLGSDKGQAVSTIFAKGWKNRCSSGGDYCIFCILAKCMMEHFSVHIL